MILNIDVKGLEVVCAAFLSQDKILYRELNDGLDIHSDNQTKFGLPDRITAKVFKFKLLYGAMEYGFSQDPDFTFISTSPKYWKKVIDKYYEKYKGIGSWHSKIISEVARTGMLTSPSGRTYKWEIRGDRLPTTEIKNYMVQGFGADIVACARVSMFNRWKKAGMKGKMVNTVHDSIVCDITSDELDKAVVLVKEVFQELPSQLNRIFGINFDLEVKVEILYGNNQFNLEEYK